MLADVVVRPGCGVVTSADGRIVAESVTTAMIGRVPLDDAELRRDPIHVDGTVAVFRSPQRSTFHTLVDDLPRAALLIHPALGRLGNMSVLHDGPLTDMEATLLEHLGGRRVQLVEVEPGQPIHADRVVVPNFVTRPGAGAVPSWFRRWCDQVPLPCAAQGPRRIFLDAGSAAGVENRADLLEVLERHGVEPLDPSSLKPDLLLATLRDADVVVGSADGGLTGCLFSHRAHVVELLDDVTLDPAMYYLAACKGLPYDYVPAVAPATPARRSGRDRRSGAEVTIDIGWIDRLLDRVAA
ncbi:glycosyltransferase family 61 protein [Dermatobacter hominis]|uniref:glycosyltransferase family 61 protein n=1 Tax=Dermatobacter hominis TaxID=2884263 RepID=UPI001D12E39A|nr:glycosyltransferase family 61 protein [Dermatobacter hominis]UDY36365.1 glycosyltransferase family 61 protein [Dermatobacter hominis]